MRRFGWVALLLAGCGRLDDARWIDEGADCVREDVHRVQGGGCGDAETLTIAPDGTCWRFSTTCIPAGFDTATDETGCTYERFETLPACP